MRDGGWPGAPRIRRPGRSRGHRRCTGSAPAAGRGSHAAPARRAPARPAAGSGTRPRSGRRSRRRSAHARLPATRQIASASARCTAEARASTRSPAVATPFEQRGPVDSRQALGIDDERQLRELTLAARARLEPHRSLPLETRLGHAEHDGRHCIEYPARCAGPRRIHAAAPGLAHDRIGHGDAGSRRRLPSRAPRRCATVIAPPCRRPAAGTTAGSRRDSTHPVVRRRSRHPRACRPRRSRRRPTRTRSPVRTRRARSRAPRHARGGETQSNAAARSPAPSGSSCSRDAHRRASRRGGHVVQALQVGDDLLEDLSRCAACPCRRCAARRRRAGPRRARRRASGARRPRAPARAARPAARARAAPCRDRGGSDARGPRRRASTESSAGRTIGRSWCRKASATVASLASASAGSVSTGSPLTLPEVATTGPPNASSSRWCSGL